ncbi:portal protein [Rhodococcus phage REQ1]|uniref:portal protein n=1 Tax=Rhodococcus phage REQ1 TaxID=1109712 RepID=UPI00023EEC66|nr:portal protein [Rhodococcus phage REQ1]AEV52064.1 portal protein [Rhodococcus phage REQ1]
MAKLWHHLRGRGHPTEQRFGLDDLAQWYRQDNLLPWAQRQGYSNTEAIDNDFEGYVRGAYKANGAVFAVALARMLVFTEVRFSYQRYTEDGRPGDLYRRPSLKILDKPWPNGATGDLLARAIQDTDLAGNHYVVREGSGPNARLRRLRPDWVSIILTSPPDKAVQSDVVGYLYKPGGTDNKELWKLYPVDGSNGAIAHWTPIPDPEAAYRGMSWLTPVLREIMHDNAATKHKLKFFENAATPNLAVSFKETVTAEQFKEFMEQLDDSHGGGDNAYKTLYLGGGADVRVIGSKMEEINFKSTQGLSESRIAAAGRIHPALVGLSEGLQGSSLNEGNYKAARNNFADATMRPLWRSLCAAYSVLVEEFDDSRLWYDARDVEFLRQDQKELAEITAQNASTISKLVMQGYTPESVTEAIVKEDLRLLKHTGLYSVQLQPPGTIGKGALTGQTPATQTDDVKKVLNQVKKDPKAVVDVKNPKQPTVGQDKAK